MGAARAEADIARHFGRRLKDLRLARGLTQIQLAKVLGYSSHGYLSALEQGQKSPTVELVVRVAAYFGVSTDELLRAQEASGPRPTYGR